METICNCHSVTGILLKSVFSFRFADAADSSIEVRL